MSNVASGLRMMLYITDRARPADPESLLSDDCNGWKQGEAKWGQEAARLRGELSNVQKVATKFEGRVHAAELDARHQTALANAAMEEKQLLLLDIAGLRADLQASQVGIVTILGANAKRACVSGAILLGVREREREAATSALMPGWLIGAD